MAPFPSKLSTRSGTSSISVINTGNLYVSGDLDPPCVRAADLPPPSIPVFVNTNTNPRRGLRWTRRWRASRWRSCSSWGLQRELSSTPTGDGELVATRATTQEMVWGRRPFPIVSRCLPQKIRVGGGSLTRCRPCFPLWWGPAALTWSSSPALWARFFGAGRHEATISGQHGSLCCLPSTRAFLTAHSFPPDVDHAQQVLLLRKSAFLSTDVEVVKQVRVFGMTVKVS
jgi:hypothetical protein